MGSLIKTNYFQIGSLPIAFSDDTCNYRCEFFTAPKAPDSSKIIYKNASEAKCAFVSF